MRYRGGVPRRCSIVCRRLEGWWRSEGRGYAGRGRGYAGRGRGAGGSWWWPRGGGSRGGGGGTRSGRSPRLVAEEIILALLAITRERWTCS